MGRLVRKKRSYASPAGYRSGRGRSYGARSGRRNGGFAEFVRRYFKLLAICFVVAVIGVLCVVLFTGNTDTSVSAIEGDDTQIATGDDSEYDYSEYDDDMIAGLEGHEAAFMDDDPIEKIMEEGIRIGVTIGSLSGKEQEFVINRLEEASLLAKQSAEIYVTFFYNAGGGLNQQIQDVRSLINKDVDVIIIAYTDKESFEAITLLAKEEGVPIVAYDAPVSGGYAINVVTDYQAWGDAYGRFMAQNLTAGNVAGFFGIKDGVEANARGGAINAALSANQQIKTSEPVYTNWNEKTAKTEAEKLLADKAVDGVICEEGLASAVLDVFVQSGKLPKVMCGDVTAGFIKKWYTLKNEGINIAPPPGKNQTPPPPVMVTAEPDGFIVCAQPSPAGGAAAAFDFALGIAKGRKLKQEGQTFKFNVQTMITEENLASYYSMVKDKEDAFLITERLSEDMINALFES
ncbi:MAG: substrate-binding domain-containing protein [Christensenellales bacterium]